MQRSVWTKSAGRGQGTGGRGQRASDPLMQLDKHPGNDNQQCETLCKGNAGEPFQSLKYEEACAMIRQNVEKFIDDQESSESEDDLDDYGIIKNTFESYGGDNTTDLRKTQEFLQNSLTSGAVVCLICIESVKRNDPVWSCQNCYCMLHVPCIQKWAKDSIFYQSSNLDDNSKKISLKWCCPKCRQEYKPADKPSKYFCFCGKVEDPPFNPWHVPHSCGQTCEKKLKPHCGHDCLLLCHPGPCPPCPKTVETRCYCGKSLPVTRRCSDSLWSCNHLCKRLLSCGQHFCEQHCHGGDCPPCSKQSLQNCLCGNEKELQPCNKPSWQCEKVCVKPLECGNHFCLTKCHSGECSSCPKAKPRPCPCKKKLVLLPCTEEVPPCGDTCDKLLECELHKCSQRCHHGPCGSCLQVRIMKCRCGQREKSVPCSKEYICDIKCKRRRDCGKHNCNKKCCSGNCPVCEAPCGRPLNCGSHKCKSRCHPGPCYPCRETVEITCNCGSAKITVPCGMKRSAVPPRCAAPCKDPPNCHHLERHKHRCHFGTCPPCRNVCGKSLQCGHMCPVRCHSAVLTKVESNKKKEGPWDLVNSYRMELVCEPCPPCVIPVPYTCLGGHETQNFPCSEARPWSCGRKCGHHLMCSNHTCQLECHITDTEKNSFKQSDRCEPCQQPCSKVRPKGCSHPCLRPCHPDSCPPCMQRLKMRCHCQLNPIYLICDEWVYADNAKKDTMLSCKNRCPKELSCGHRCPMICHQGECAGPQMCKKKIIIRCPCKRQKQEMLCNIQIQNPSYLSCDNECYQQQQIEKSEKLAQENRQREEEAKKQQQEFDEFQRKMEGKKKKHKKIREVVERTPWWRQYFCWTLSVVICVLGIFIYIFFLTTKVI